MPEPKYNLSTPTEAEQSAFMKDFGELLEKHSMYFEPVPQWQRKDMSSPWETACQIFLQKKTPVVEEVKAEEPVPSPFVPENA